LSLTFLLLSLVPRPLPSPLPHTVHTAQYATKSWGGAWERAPEELVLWERSTYEGGMC